MSARPFETPCWMQLATGRSHGKGQKSSAAGKPKGAEGDTKERDEKRRENRKKSRDAGKEETPQRGRKTAQRRDAALRSSLDVTREKNIPRVKFRMCLCTCVCVCVCARARMCTWDSDDGIRKSADLNGTRGKTALDWKKSRRATDKSGLADRPITYVRQCLFGNRAFYGSSRDLIEFYDIVRY